MRIALLMALFLTVSMVYAAPDTVQTVTGDLQCRIIEDTGSLLVVETVAGDFVGLRKSSIINVVRGSEDDFYLMRGEHFEQKEKDEQALLEYLQALKRNPANDEAGKRIDSINRRHKVQRFEEKMLTGRQLLARSQYQKALKAFQDILRDNPEDEFAREVVNEMCLTYTKMAFHYYDHCYDEGAIRELAKAEELNPESAEIYYIMGRIHHDARKFELARQEYERALELDPNHIQARMRLLSLIEQRRSGRLFSRL